MIKYAPNADVLVDSNGTRGAVLKGIANHTWVHLACHAYPSRIPMHDGSLTILDLINTSVSHAGMAVLSASGSAKPSETLPGECFHPAGAMLFAGFSSVVGTLWGLDDGVMPLVAEEFYKHISEGQKETGAAGALRKAVKGLSRKDVSFMQQVNFVHFGV